jgi:hypothetical protein
MDSFEPRLFGANPGREHVSRLHCSRSPNDQSGALRLPDSRGVSGRQLQSSSVSGRHRNDYDFAAPTASVLLGLPGGLLGGQQG